jgi:hypothetical protein
MNTFGTIKTKIENVFTDLYGKKEFKPFMNQFKIMVLENKDIAELYAIYDDLKTNKGLPKDIADDYVNESIEYSQVLIETNTNKLYKLDKWISNFNNKNTNDYKDIDFPIYNTSIRNLEKILESKNKIKKTITESAKKEVEKEILNLPLSSMINVANKTINSKFSNISEEDKKELNSIVSLSLDEVKKEMESLKENVKTKLTNNLNESKDFELKEKINNTIKKLDESKIDHYNLYKLRKLNEGL